MRIVFPPIILFTFLFFFHLSAALNVNNAEELISIFEQSTGGTVKEDIDILQDLDFSQAGLSLPLGTNTDGTCRAFSGTVRGHGHAILGLVFNNGANTNAGLFCSLTEASVEDLIIDNSCTFTGSFAGALSVSVNGSVVVRNVTNKAAVSGVTRVGGLIGFVENQKQGHVVLTLDGCKSEGDISGSTGVGGLLGIVFKNTEIKIIISQSHNNASVSGKIYVGGFVGSISGNSAIKIEISNSTNCGIVNGASIAGGFVGEMNGNKVLSITVKESSNHGTITSQNDNIGGIIGRTSDCTASDITISNSFNNGNISGASWVGGFLGSIRSSHDFRSL